MDHWNAIRIDYIRLWLKPLKRGSRLVLSNPRFVGFSWLRHHWSNSPFRMREVSFRRCCFSWCSRQQTLWGKFPGDYYKNVRGRGLQSFQIDQRRDCLLGPQLQETQEKKGKHTLDYYWNFFWKAKLVIQYELLFSRKLPALPCFSTSMIFATLWRVSFPFRS